MAKDKKYCPLKAAGWDEGKEPPFCDEEQCAWWQTYANGTVYEYSECAIKGLTNLADLANR